MGGDISFTELYLSPGIAYAASWTSSSYSDGKQQGKGLGKRDALLGLGMEEKMKKCGREEAVE